VPDPACDRPVRIFAREFLCVGARIEMRRAIGITFHGNGGHGDDRAFSKPARLISSDILGSPLNWIQGDATGVAWTYGAVTRAHLLDEQFHRFWYGWKMKSLAFTATWHVCPQSDGLGSAVNFSDEAS
jgi:hypothetical protein